MIVRRSYGPHRDRSQGQSGASYGWEDPCERIHPEVIAEGEEYPVARSQQGDSTVENWTERRLVVRSMRQAQAAEAALRARVAKALAQSEALNQCGRGKKRLETLAA
jgi:hypothetical protein